MQWMLVVFLYLFALLEQSLACVENVPKYLDNGWNDDYAIPNWILKRGSGNTNLMMVMHNLTFTCSGRLRNWYYWWRADHVNEDCNIGFGFHVLRPARNGTHCNPTIVGSRYKQKSFSSYAIHVRPTPEVIEEDGREILVQKGDYIAVQLHLSVQCSSSTRAWLRGLVQPSSVSIKKDQRYIFPAGGSGCDDENFIDMSYGVGFISALVEPASTSVLPDTSIHQYTMDPCAYTLESSVDEIVVTRQRPVATTSKHPSMNPAPTLTPMQSSSHIHETMSEDETGTISPGPCPTILSTMIPFRGSSSHPTVLSPHKICNTTSYILCPSLTSGTVGANIDKDKLLLLLTVCSLSLCALMTVTCLVGVTVILCRRKSGDQTAKASSNVECATESGSNGSTAVTWRRISEENGSDIRQDPIVPEYDYIQPQVIMEENAAYHNSGSTTSFTTFL